MTQVHEHLDRSRHGGDLPLAPPRWASRSIPEDGGVTHETVSPLHPMIKLWADHGWEFVPTEVSVSTVDLQVDGRWIRTLPTVQIEAGSYSLDGARQLRAILDTFLKSVAADEPGQPPGNATDADRGR